MSTFKYNRLDKNNAAVLLVDHQTGLFSLVRNIGAADFKNNVLALASAAKFFNLPTVLTTSFEPGPNGVILPELKEKFPDAPFIPRPGQINAWDNEEFVKAVEATGIPDYKNLMTNYAATANSGSPSSEKAPTLERV